MAKAVRDKSDIEEQLQRSVKFLKRSAKDFDDGDEDEASRLALEIRKLVHDTDKSHSILGQLGRKTSLQFVDSGRYRDRFNKAANEFAAKEQPGYAIAESPIQVGLVLPGMQDGAPKWYAPLGIRYQNADYRSGAYHPGPRDFNSWWTGKLVEGSSGHKFSRKDLVLLTANQESGAHVDPEIDVTYTELLADMMGLSAAAFGKQPSVLELHNLPLHKPVNNVIYVSIRQIADEVLKTLDPTYKAERKTWPEELMILTPFAK